MFEVFTLDFMQVSFAVGTLVAFILPFIGQFFVVRNYSLLAETLSRVSFIGLVASMISPLGSLLVTTVVSVLLALLVEKLRSTKDIPSDALLISFMYGVMAIAIMAVSVLDLQHFDLISTMFGSILYVEMSDFWFMLVTVMVVGGIIIALYRSFFLMALNEELAMANRVPVKFLNLLLIAMAAVVISVSVEIIGVLLIGALLTMPVLISMRFQFGFLGTLIRGVIISIFATDGGLYLSYYLDTPSGVTVVTILFGLFLLTSIPLPRWLKRSE